MTDAEHPGGGGVSAAYGRSGTKDAKLREAVHKRLLAHEGTVDGLPTSNRFLLYELPGAGAAVRAQEPRPAVGHRPLPHPSRSETPS
jgi:hypothetical protein